MSDPSEMASVLRRLKRRHGSAGRSKSNKRVTKDDGASCHESEPLAHAALHSESEPVGAGHCDALQLDSETLKEDAYKGSRSRERDSPPHDVLYSKSGSVGAVYCDSFRLDSGSTFENDDQSSTDHPHQLLACSMVTRASPTDVIDLTGNDDENTEKEGGNVPPNSSFVATYTQASKRPRTDDDRRLRLGTFASGRSIYRNRLHPGETLQDGHVSISNLVLPGTLSSVCTTFAGPNDMSWLESFLDGVNDLIVVQEDTSPRVVGDAELISMNENKRPGWYSLTLKPHTGGCLHAKLLLFRSELGLRVVVCGSNLYQEQWESDRDCLWVQDFFCSTHNGDDDDDDDEGEDSSTTTTTTNNSFGPCLRTFLDDLTKCRTERDQKLLATRLKALFNGINFETASARLVFSFPRPRNSRQSRGGWRLLAKSVRGLLRKHTDDSEDADSTKHSAVPGLVHAMAGSMGNIKPDFILQMHQAMHGIDDPVPKKKKTELAGNKRNKVSKNVGSSVNAAVSETTTLSQHGVDLIAKEKESAMVEDGTRISAVETSPHQDSDEIGDSDWDQVEDLGLRCLWPSRQTAQSMCFHSIISNLRAMPLSFWKSIKVRARRKIFFDASPNPTVMGLPHLACHPVSHAKVIIKTGGGGIGVIYVGSHNFSRSAWGLHGAMPKNVEMGVVLASRLTSLTQEWCSRLPCLLPEANAQSPSTYVPASAHTGIRQAYQEGRWIEAFQTLADWLKSADYEQEADAEIETGRD